LINHGKILIFAYKNFFMLPRKNASKEEKKQYLMDKFVEKTKFSLDDIKKYAVFWRPIDKEIDTWKLISVCSSLDEAKLEVQWRMEYHKTNNGNMVLDHDSRFETFRDETQHKDKNGKTYEPGEEHMVNMDRVSPYDSMLQALPEAKGKFRSMAYCANIELNYKGYYKIDEVYDVS